MLVLRVADALLDMEGVLVVPTLAVAVCDSEVSPLAVGLAEGESEEVGDGGGGTVACELAEVMAVGALEGLGTRLALVEAQPLPEADSVRLCAWE